MKISQNIIIKVLLILIAIFLVVGIFSFRSIKNDLNLELEERQKIIDDLKNEKIQVIDSVKNASLNEVNSLKSEINNLSKYSRSLINKIRDYEKSPNYDIDYLTAVDILSRSNYKKRNDSIVKRENN